MPIYNPVIHQTSTLIVAASDSLYAERVDYTCDGTADDVEINAAFALGAANTRVVLLDGTYTLADPIIFTHNNQMLEGQGRATFIDGDGLATTEHGILIDALTNITVKNLAIQTEDGGGKSCNCIQIIDGSRYCRIENVTIVDSDEDGIHIEGTQSSDLSIIGCHIEDTDNQGIYSAPGTLPSRYRIIDNTIRSSGAYGMYLCRMQDSVVSGNHIINSSSCGMVIFGATTRTNITNNTIYSCSQSGIWTMTLTYCNIEGNVLVDNSVHGLLLETSDKCSIVGNTCDDNTQRGIYLLRSDYNTITGNSCNDNGTDGINVTGDATGNSDYNMVSGNTCTGNGDDGIEIAQTGATANGNMVMGNMVRGNTGTAIVDGGTLTAIRDNEGISFGDEYGATFIVAASNSLQPANADYVCDGTADDVQIQAALDDLPAIGGRVILLEGTYTIVDQINIPGDDITLEGQGRATFIDGDGLATTEDAIKMNARSNVVIKNLAIQTEDGGGKDCNCISLNGPSAGVVIEGIIIVESDNLGITIEGGANVSDTRISNCVIEGADLHGIRVSMAGGVYCDRLTVENCIITGCGGLGISLTGVGAGNRYCKITNNTTYSCSSHGIAIYEADYGVIADNVSYSNTTQGIFLGDSSYATITGNTCYDNDSGGTTYNGIQISACSHCAIGNNNCRANGLHGIYIRRCSNCVINGNICSGQNTGDGINITGDGTANSDYNIISGNVCEGNGDDGIEIAGGTDANSNQVIGNMLQGNSGTALVDGGTLTVIKDNEGMVGFGDDKAATLVVAASNSIQPANSDYYCDGTADDVQINAALAAAGAGGRVVLLEGTFTIVDPIVFTNNNQVLEGQGRGSFIDGDGLATTEHAIQIDAKTNCTVRNLAVQTADGGGNTIHCIYLNDGANYTTIDGVIIIDSDSDGIHIEGTDCQDIQIRNCVILDTDDAGIDIDLDAGDYCDRLIITNCAIQSTGAQGIVFGATGAGARYCVVSDNIVSDANHEGISLSEFLYGTVEGNIVVSSLYHGISLNSSNNTTIDGNVCTGNDSGAAGMYHGIVLSVADKSTVIGNNCYGNGQHGIYLIRSDYNNVTGNICTDNVTGDGIHIIGDGTGNSDYNTIADNECYGNASDGIEVVGGTDANGNHITGNYIVGNSVYGISVAGLATKIEDNYVYHNGGGAAGTYHGIYLAGTSDRCSINNNTIEDDGTDTEDGICLADGAINCQITGNYIYNLMGDGIKLTANNTSTHISDNYCLTLDENGIVITDSVDCTVSGNHCENNTHHGIYLDNVDEANVSNNYCRGNDRLNSTTYDGIYVDVDSSYVNIVGNHCTENDRYGIYVLSVTCELTANHALTNTTGQISAAAGCVLAHNETGATAEVHEPREATIVVAASDSLTASADYVCDGTADEVQINAALNALPTDGGRVILLEGTFVTAATITIPDDSITLEGQGRATLIDGDGLTAAVNAITISAKDDVAIKNLAVQTEAGAEPAKGHCIYGENGCDRLLIENVTVIDSGDDGIHLTGTITYDVRIIGCNIMDGDGHGIYLAINPAYRFSLRDNTVKDVRDYGIYIGGNFLGEVTGNNVTDATQAGIFAWAGVNMIITNNTCRSCGTYGIYLNLCPTNTIMGNVCVSNTSHGMYVFRCLYCVINGNMCYANGTDGINITGDATHNSDYNTLTGNVCTGNADDGIAIEGVGDANKNVVVANNLMDNAGTNLVDNGTATQIGHNVTA